MLSSSYLFSDTWKIFLHTYARLLKLVGNRKLVYLTWPTKWHAISIGRMPKLACSSTHRGACTRRESHGATAPRSMHCKLDPGRPTPQPHRRRSARKAILQLPLAHFAACGSDSLPAAPTQDATTPITPPPVISRDLPPAARHSHSCQGTQLTPSIIRALAFWASASPSPSLQVCHCPLPTALFSHFQRCRFCCFQRSSGATLLPVLYVGGGTEIILWFLFPSSMELVTSV
jgi:hypothetical protein